MTLPRTHLTTDRSPTIGSFELTGPATPTTHGDRHPILERVGIVAAYVVLGGVGTAVIALALLNRVLPIQQVVYDACYLQVGSSEATETAILTHVFLAAFTEIGGVLLAGDYLSHRLAHRTAVMKAIEVLLESLVAFLVVAVLELAAFLTALVVLAVVPAVPLLLRYRYRVRSGGIPALVGGIPIRPPATVSRVRPGLEMGILDDRPGGTRLGGERIVFRGLRRRPPDPG